ncbi:MAG: hypothetical protein C0592_05225 [Marinilabiliales bacterium]|nr:MAG: hypothetical protein C0592_05225 [Marinilabiliales bacterium]
MKKIIALLILGLLISDTLHSQCTTNPPSYNSGLYPDTLSTACTSSMYYDTTVVVFPLDTMLSVPPFGTFIIPLDSAVIDSITNIPNGLTPNISIGTMLYPASPTIPAMDCIEFFGVPISPQTYSPIKIHFTVWVTVPLVGVQSFSDSTNLYLNIANSSSALIDTTVCKSFQATGSSNIFYTSGTHYDTIQNNAGCDSILTIQLTVTEIDSTVIQSGDTLFAVDTVDSYQWVTCDTAMAAIAGATDSFYVVPATGMYALILEKNGCYDTSACINVTITGIEALHKNDIRVYPNPVSDKIYIDLDRNHEEIQLNIRNSVGQTVLSRHYFNTSKINTSIDFNTGIYIMEIIEKDCYTIYRDIIIVE